MVEPAKDEAYINYTDYSNYKYKFSTVAESSIDLNKLNELISKSKENSKITQTDKIYKAFKELYRHLKHNGIFYYYSPNACLYISYILHKVVEKGIGELYSPELYQTLHEFVIQYNKDLSTKNNTCIKELVYIDYNLFKEMNTLYKVYDEYHDFLAYNYHPNTTNCGKLDKLVLIYKDYINTHESKSTNFNNILTHLEKSFKKTLEKYDPQCKSKNIPLPHLKLFNPPEEKQPKVLKPEEQPHSSPSVLITSQELQQRLPEHTNSQKYSEKAQIELPQEHSKDVVDHGRAEEIQIDQQRRNTEETIEIEKTREVEGQGTSRFSLNTRSPQQYSFSETLTNPRLGSIGTSEYLIRPDTQLETGVFDQMKNTISNVLGSVDPVPVVGVSGGMGALFLLFRYTPVGAFFRGGRGRVHRIPRSFNGPFPGGFPGYEEYDGGYIGYSQMSSLAE